MTQIQLTLTPPSNKIVSHETHIILGSKLVLCM